MKTNNLNIKEALYQKCQEHLQQRLDVILHKIEDLQQALSNETKSTAGDKHETGRAMLQLEQEKSGAQLYEIRKTIAALQAVNTAATYKKITIGSLVYTSLSNYYIAVSCGEIQVSNTSYFVISPASPLAQLLLTKQEGDSVHFRTSTIQIQKVL